MKTKYSSYNLNSLPKGCQYCVKGEKLVLFISGKCSRNCWYCSLSNKRKNKDIIWANEREIKNIKELIQEVKESNATSAGITGGDPLLFIKRTLKYAKALKKKFGKSFHIHIYLPTKFVNKNNLKKLSRYIDEVRFNPEFSAINNTNSREDASQKPLGVWDKDIKKISIAKNFWKKQNIGIELPMIPNRKKDFLDFIIKISPYISFVNLNEFELSETNMSNVTKKYKLNEGGYVIKDSKQAGIWLLNQLKKNKTNLKVHFCTAELKNNHQFKNRLKLHNILPYGKKTKEGLVKYLITYKKPNQKPYYFDKQKKRYILPEKTAKQLIGDYKIFLVEEFPTHDRIEVEKEEIKI